MPTISEIRDAYAWQDNYPHAGEINQEASADFDAWLEAHDREVSRRAWFQGAASRQCHCHAYSEGECACGMWPSETNPYELPR